MHVKPQSPPSHDSRRLPACVCATGPRGRARRFVHRPLALPRLAPGAGPPAPVAALLWAALPPARCGGGSAAATQPRCSAQPVRRAGERWRWEPLRQRARSGGWGRGRAGRGGNSARIHRVSVRGRLRGDARCGLRCRAVPALPADGASGTPLPPGSAPRAGAALISPRSLTHFVTSSLPMLCLPPLTHFLTSRARSPIVPTRWPARPRRVRGFRSRKVMLSGGRGLWLGAPPSIDRCHVRVRERR